LTVNAAGHETFSFQAEAAQILKLMTHSLYSNKEIFLRELISNASDAIDRLRFESSSGTEEQSGPPQIRVTYDRDAATITVADNGIGMGRQDVIDHLGTIARSGTREFLKRLTGDQRKDSGLIGQFGVGFYSAFIVAERVVLTTRRAGLAGDEAVRWESDGLGEYSLASVERAEHGTTIVLHLREGESDLLNGFRLRSIIEKYSDHIRYPIVMPDPAGADPAAEQTPVNAGSALWARPKSELTTADYAEFYRSLSHGLEDPLAHVHSKVEGTYDYTMLLFVPARATPGLFLPQSHAAVRLHVNRVFIMEDSGQLLPSYLRFVSGVIDSSDLPLNVSREILQGSRAVDHIRSSAVKKVLKLLAGTAESEPEKYADFWHDFGSVLKEGVAEDYTHRPELVRLLRFATTTTGADGPLASLDDYVARMKEGQEHIYYLLAPRTANAEASPHLEMFRAKGIEVLLLNEAVDNWVVSSLRDFDGHRLRSVTQGVQNAGPDEKDEAHEAERTEEFRPLLEALKEALGPKIWDVRLSERLTTSPACIVSDEAETDITLVRRLRGTGLPGQPILEINPTHALITRLAAAPDPAALQDWAHVLYGQAVITFGARLDDPSAFTNHLNNLLTTSFRE